MREMARVCKSAESGACAHERESAWLPPARVCARTCPCMKGTQTFAKIFVSFTFANVRFFPPSAQRAAINGRKHLPHSRNDTMPNAALTFLQNDTESAPTICSFLRASSHSLIVCDCLGLRVFYRGEIPAIQCVPGQRLFREYLEGSCCRRRLRIILALTLPCHLLVSSFCCCALLPPPEACALI